MIICSSEGDQLCLPDTRVPGKYSGHFQHTTGNTLLSITRLHLEGFKFTIAHAIFKTKLTKAKTLSFQIHYIEGLNFQTS